MFVIWFLGKKETDEAGVMYTPRIPHELLCLQPCVQIIRQLYISDLEWLRNCFQMAGMKKVI